jgi:hypothetical protein
VRRSGGLVGRCLSGLGLFRGRGDDDRSEERELTNPAHATLARIGVLGYMLAHKQGQLFREGLLQVMKSQCEPRDPGLLVEGGDSPVVIETEKGVPTHG